MGAIHVHEFMSLDGVIDAPTWTFDYGFHPRMGEAIGAVTERCRGILLGRTTYEMFEPAWSTRTVEDDPGAPFFNDTTKYVVSGDAHDRDVEELEGHRAVRPRRDPQPEGRGRRRPLRQRQRHAGAGDARGRPGRRAASVRLPADPRLRSAALPQDAAPAKLSLAACESYENGVVYLAYRPQALKPHGGPGAGRRRTHLDALRHDRGARHHDAVRRRGGSEGRLRARGRSATATTTRRVTR